MAYCPRRFPRIPSVRTLSSALSLDCFQLLTKTFSRPFPFCVSCVSIHGNLVRQAFQLHLLEQVPKTSPWCLPGLQPDTAPGRSRFDGSTDSTCANASSRMCQRKQSKHRCVVRQTKCISFSYYRYGTRTYCRNTGPNVLLFSLYASQSASPPPL